MTSQYIIWTILTLLQFCFLLGQTFCPKCISSTFHQAWFNQIFFNGVFALDQGRVSNFVPSLLMICFTSLSFRNVENLSGEIFELQSLTNYIPLCHFLSIQISIGNQPSRLRGIFEGSFHSTTFLYYIALLFGFGNIGWHRNPNINPKNHLVGQLPMLPHKSSYS